VGAKLVYPGIREQIQHCGIVMTERGPKHLCAHQSDEFTYYFGRNRWNYNYLAVTGACLMVSAKKFAKVGGFDETFPVAYNDVDLCMSLTEAGYYNVVRNDVKLIHKESVSRGRDVADAAKEKRLAEDWFRLKQKHPKFAKEDPFYNPNLKVVTFP
jgi:GT2 family glycosyltransferase